MQPRSFAVPALVSTVLFVLSYALTTQRTSQQVRARDARQPACPGEEDAGHARPAAPLQWAQVLRDAQMLSMATVVGAASTWAYWRTGGALWAAWLVHAAAVVPWVVLLGGHAKTHSPPA